MIRVAPVAAAAICALANFASLARAADAQQPAEPFSLAPTDSPKYLDENLPSLAPGAPTSLNSNRAPLMAALANVGVAQSLDQARVNIYGYVEGSYTYNFNNPAQGLNLGREFDINDNRPQLNQADLKIERKADPHQWDLGGMLEMNFGTDDRFIHSSGFFDHSNNPFSNSIDNGAEYQFDVPQIYLDLTAPWGKGVRFRFGKFLFFKQIDPNASVFYSHSFTFGAALPFTLTGVTAYYQFNDQWSIEGGIARGWGQTLRDNNGAIDALGRVKYKINDKTEASLALVIGPELDHDNSHYRTVLDGTVSYAMNDNLTLLADGVFGYEAEPSGTGDDYWYGLSGYAVYKVSDMLNVNARGEFYRDEEGFTTGIPQTLFEATLGVTLTPFPNNDIGSNLKLRPEVRYDYSTGDYFNGLTKHSQFTMAVDAYFDF
jgi:hypothetical protein